MCIYFVVITVRNGPVAVPYLSDGPLCDRESLTPPYGYKIELINTYTGIYMDTYTGVCTCKVYNVFTLCVQNFSSKCTKNILNQ